jgi:hypothetical protein
VVLKLGENPSPALRDGQRKAGTNGRPSYEGPKTSRGEQPKREPHRLLYNMVHGDGLSTGLLHNLFAAVRDGV